MIGRAEFTYRLYQRAHVFGIYIRRDAMTQVEHVAITVAETLQDFAYFAPDHLGR